eukprot:CAMPEP_0116149134 /NCGR_PEP_ID=MMETSP0329-20121206/18761_1 /TAXON_ID=697910 /ORGANISM="Pseudo-nitzschia arenysensis, Strain B593" /LENGTH=541 /DNA_ID=CAMNT_0003645379 /DNA_START=65 /DNA_END=1690 /DNA_ORIENTATION=+
MTIISKLFLVLALSSSTFDRCSVVAQDGYWEPFAHFPSDLPAKKPRIVNGARSDPSNARFFARAGYDEYFFTSDILCGSTLIWSDILITAAHCQGAFNSGALVLDPNTNDYTRLAPIDRQVRHPGWSISRQNLNYDVLVMRLATPLSSSDVAQPISINKDSFYPSRQQSLMAHGFGMTEDQVMSEYLREAEVTYISNDDCWGRGISFNNVMKSEEVMCTDPYDDKTATCLGDSGGPLTDFSRTTLVGVISFGSGCDADHIPDGHVRISEVHDWIEDQICLLSANPPATCGNKEPLDPRSVEVVIDFTHDFYPEHTTFAIKDKKTQEIVYAGPEYIPTRSGNHRETVFLLPGDYSFDVYDVHGDGLQSSQGNGSWKMLALYDGATETEVATGGADFNNQQVTRFVLGERTFPLDDNDTVDTSPDNDVGVVISDQLNKCSELKEAALANEEMFSSTCSCVASSTSQDIVLSCFHESGVICAHQYQSCSTSDECCGEFECDGGKCGREARVPVSLGRDRNRISGSSASGGAATRGPGRHNLRRK